MLSTVVIALSLTCSSAPVANLLTSSRRIGSTAKWSGYIHNQACYEWIDSKTLLYYTNNPLKPGDWTIHKFDIDSKASRTLSGLTKQYTRTRSGVGGLAPSPDRKLYLGQRSGTSPQFYLVDLEGNEKASWPIRRTGSRWDPTAQTNLCWTPDSKALFESVLDFEGGSPQSKSWLRKIGQLRVAHPQSTTEFRGVSLRFLNPTVGAGNRCFQVIDEKYTGTGVRNEQTIISWSLDTPKTITKKRVSFSGEEICGSEFSPSGRMILWETSTAPASPGSWVYEPRNSKKRPKGPHYAKLWTTTCDGAAKRLLGQVQLKKGDEYLDWHTFGWIRWLPGEKQVSFLFRRSLYVFDIPSQHK
jgi:hypothetical protein